VEAFVRAYATLDYVRCVDGLLEADFEKVAIYATNDAGQPVPTHAARQLSDGRWTSKLGNHEDIEHTNPAAVNCPTYGDIVVYLKRPRPAAN
jgi:hypothetical protein